jgi:hypothetical protein
MTQGTAWIKQQSRQDHEELMLRAPKVTQAAMMEPMYQQVLINAVV